MVEPFNNRRMTTKSSPRKPDRPRPAAQEFGDLSTHRFTEGVEDSGRRLVAHE